MIVESIVNILFAIVNTLINFIPVFDTSSIGGFTAILTSFVACSAFMPMSAFSQAITAFLGIQTIKLGSSTINWILRKVMLG